MNPIRAGTKKFHLHSRAQALVEFAIIVPILLLVLTGIIEFGYAFYTWAAIGEVARIGTRYAVTGRYDPQYCPAAAAALTTSVASWPYLAAEDSADGAADCVVQSNIADFEAKTAALQDWARIPSTRDAAMNGGAIGLLFDPGVSGDYIQFLSDVFPRDGLLPNDGFKDNYRGDPTANGYISINICSNRAGVGFDPAARYYNDLTGDSDAHFLGVCVVNNQYKDDAGGPGDRIRLTVTYNHPLIIPFFEALWPHLKLSTTQDAIVEKFRTSRLAGLSSGISVLATWSPTPAPTDTPTQTSIPPTATSTYTNTPTPLPCVVPPGGNGLLARFFAYFGNQNTNAFTNLVYSRTDREVNFDWGNNSPVPGSVPVDYFRVEWTGKVYPPYPGDYNFYTWSDDGVRLYIDGNLIINNWTNHGSTKNYSGYQSLSCGAHDIRMEFYENSGGAVAKLGWTNGNTGDMLPIQQKYLFSPVIFEPTSTYLTPTPTRTYTPKATKTPKPPTSTYTPTVYQPPTHTFTPRPTTAATNTLVPSNTPTKTATLTPRPTCGISSDAGGCTPIP